MTTFLLCETETISNGGFSTSFGADDEEFETVEGDGRTIAMKGLDGISKGFCGRGGEGDNILWIKGKRIARDIEFNEIKFSQGGKTLETIVGDVETTEMSQMTNGWRESCELIVL